MRQALTWIDVIIAGMLVVLGTAAWQYADTAVSRLWLDDPPDKAEFLLTQSVRFRELRVERTKAELAAAVTKASTEALVSDAQAAPYRNRIAPLEQELVIAEKAAFDARHTATDDFEAAEFRYSVRHRSATLFVAVMFSFAGFVTLRVVSFVLTKKASMHVHWGLAMRIASCLLAPIYGFQAAGTAGAATGAVVAIFLLTRA